MEFTSLGFLLFVLVAALLFHLAENALYRRIVVAAASAVFIASYVNTPLDIVPLAAFLLLGYAAFELVRRRPSDLTLGIGLVAVIALFIFLKRFSFIEALPGLPFPYLVLGLSYILFRVLHLIIDARAGLKAAPISPLSFFNYTCGFLSFISGPIQRYGDFARGEAAVRRRPDGELAFRSFSRVVTGFLKVSVVSATANYFFLKASGRLFDELAPLGTLPYAGVYAAAVVSYTVYLLHLPLLHNVLHLYRVKNETPNSLYTKYLVTLLAQLLPISIFLYLTVERPIMRWARQRGRSASARPAGPAPVAPAPAPAIAVRGQ